MRRKAYVLSSVLVTVAILFYLFSSITLAEVWSVFVGADARAFACFIVLTLAMSFFVTWRYKLLLSIIGYHPSSTALFLVVLVRNFFSDLLPARIGTLVYIFILTGRLGVPLDAATSSFAIAFLFDIIAITPLILLALLWVGPVGYFSELAVIGASLGLAIIVIGLIVLLPRMVKFAARLSLSLPLISSTFKDKLSSLFTKIHDEFEAVQRSGVYMQVVTLSVLTRFGKYGALYAFVYALLAPLGYRLQDLSIAKVFLGLCVPEVVASLPISGIAGFGPSQGAWVLVFQLLGFPEDTSKVVTVSHHLFSKAYECVLGLIALLVLLLPVFRYHSEISKLESKMQANHRDFYVKLTISVLAITAILYILSSVPLSYLI